jgi:hypothetical protein
LGKAALRAAYQSGAARRIPKRRCAPHTKAALRAAYQSGAARRIPKRRCTPHTKAALHAAYQSGAARRMPERRCTPHARAALHAACQSGAARRIPKRRCAPHARAALHAAYQSGAARMPKARASRTAICVGELRDATNGTSMMAALLNISVETRPVVTMKRPVANSASGLSLPDCAKAFAKKSHPLSDPDLCHGDAYGKRLYFDRNLTERKGDKQRTRQNPSGNVRSDAFDSPMSPGIPKML